MMKATLPLADGGADCAAIRLVLDDVVAGEADEVTFARVEAHLATCASCRFVQAQARAYRRTMRRVGQAERAPSATREHAMELMRESRGPRS
jgi:predicted anti-sigma-YlaC factor YlaD